MATQVFAPGCAFMLYKPELAEKLHKVLIQGLGEMDLLLTCCHHDPKVTVPTEVINICPGCDKRFGNDYDQVSTISLFEILADIDFFPFPDYRGQSMAILDACPTRNKENIHLAIRKILAKMNINVVEPQKTGTNSICCGDSFYGTISTEKVKVQMMKRTAEMPEEDVVVYCVSCIKSVFIGGKKPHYIIDLLFGEPTLAKTFEPDEWHKELDEYIAAH